MFVTTSPCSKYHFNNGVESPIFLRKYDPIKRRQGTSLMFYCLAYSCVNSPTSFKQTSTFLNIGVISEKYSFKAIWDFNIAFNKTKQMTILNVFNNLVLGQILFKMCEGAVLS